MQIFSQLIGSGVKAIAGAFTSAILLGVISGGAVLGISYVNEHQIHWPSSLVTYGIAILIAILMAYAAATTSLLRAIAKGVTGVTKGVEDEAEKVVTGHA
jgi:hypothetical protein